SVTLPTITGIIKNRLNLYGPTAPGALVNTMKRFASPSHSEAKKLKANDDDLLSLAPREVNILQYVESHAKEIHKLTEELRPKPCGAQISQKLPKHMQRRAMGHDVKRLPRSVRSQFTNKPAEKKNKCPSRRHRRRPKNLLVEYNRRQRKHVWLETHIWHAKRFHMVDKWSHRLPWKPTQRGERACYRASAQHCLIQTFSAVSCLSGTREGQTMLYHHDSYPWKAIGPVSFTWNPSQPITVQNENESSSQPLAIQTANGLTNHRQLWLWCHPACFDEVWLELVKSFSLTEKLMTKQNSASNDMKVDQEETAKETENEGINPAVCDKFKADIGAENKESNVKMKSLSGSINRFRLTGPESVAILMDILQPAKVMTSEEKKVGKQWWGEYYTDKGRILEFEEQCMFFKIASQCLSPGELQPHNISSDQSAVQTKVKCSVSSSPLWSTEVREKVLAGKHTDAEIHSFKADQIVRGQPLELGVEESAIPVILIQRPGNTFTPSNKGHLHGNNGSKDVAIGFGSGFDILFPKGWAMPFWLGLVYRGARCGGLSELEGQAHEGRELMFPNCLPDTQAGREWESSQEKELVRKYNRIPPGKRPNYTKLNVLSPFRCPWEILVNQANGDRLKLNGVNEEMNGDLKNGECMKQGDGDVTKGVQEFDGNFFVVRSLQTLRRFKKICSGGLGTSKAFDQELVSFSDDQKLGIVPVTLSMVHRGCPVQFAKICLPSLQDLQQLQKDKSFGGPLEPARVDPLEQQRNELKRELKKKGVKKAVKVDRTVTVLAETDGEKIEKGRREVIGYVCQGGFSLGTGNGGGLGYIAAAVFKKLLDQAADRKGPLVLIRNPTSLQYRFASLSVIV
ncbi:POP1-like protein, partial [Mya arenaria]